MYKWVEIYSVDFCIPDGMTTKAKATYNEAEKVYEISRRAFLQACKRIGTDEHHARCSEDVYTQTSRSEGSQWYNLKTGIRPLTW